LKEKQNEKNKNRKLFPQKESQNILLEIKKLKILNSRGNYEKEKRRESFKKDRGSGR